MKLKLHTIHSN